jgi:hypothetical protein
MLFKKKTNELRFQEVTFFLKTMLYAIMELIFEENNPLFCIEATYKKNNALHFKTVICFK